LYKNKVIETERPMKLVVVVVVVGAAIPVETSVSIVTEMPTPATLEMPSNSLSRTERFP